MTVIIWLALIVASYLIGSVPVSQIVAKLVSGIDLRQCGTGQVGAGNLWRMTSWKWALPVAIYDGAKGLVMLWVAQLAGLGAPQQLVVGLAMMAGHNWPVFLGFQGGRALGTAIGIMLILPVIDNITPWLTIVFIALLVLGTIALRSSPLPALAAVLSLPVVSWLFHEPLAVTLALLGIPVIIIIKRVMVPRPSGVTVSNTRLFFNRLLLDRDIADRAAWMYRKSSSNKPEAGDKTENR